eukprot:TRINITY_DN113705_c0_g1_i1.p1 TRINITY_DN113705_c0_g1~~TRINITY_DN113705_c0_g1_i1.p1  ORF type:complete len:197 (-),score=35.27 TRINITY_DN113705_c0_g1_i1:76-615(-)
MEQLLFLPAEPMIHKMVWSRASGNGGYSYACAIEGCEEDEAPQDLRLSLQERSEISTLQRKRACPKCDPWTLLADSPFDQMRPRPVDFSDFSHPHRAQRRWLLTTDFAEGALPAVHFKSVPGLISEPRRLFHEEGRAAAVVELKLAMRTHRERQLLSAVAWWTRVIQRQACSLQDAAAE